MIDHLALEVSDLEKSGHFYDKALEPLGYKKLMDSPQEFAGRLFLGWGDSAETDLYIAQGARNEPRLHLAFRADNREQVDAFYEAALAAGGKDNGKPDEVDEAEGLTEQDIAENEGRGGHHAHEGGGNRAFGLFHARIPEPAAERERARAVPSERHPGARLDL